jgi:hypothetical protein
MMLAHGPFGTKGRFSPVVFYGRAQRVSASGGSRLTVQQGDFENIRHVLGDDPSKSAA